MFPICFQIFFYWVRGAWGQFMYVRSADVHHVAYTVISPILGYSEEDIGLTSYKYKKWKKKFFTAWFKG